MSFWDKLKGVFKSMFSPKTIENVLKVQPVISNKMQTAIELWEQMYTGICPWLDEDVASLQLASTIASEKATMAMLEMEIKVTGDSERAEFVKDCLKKLNIDLRKNFEYGLALGGFIIKPYVTKNAKGKYVLEFSYAQMTDFYPLAYSSSNKIIDAAFIERLLRGNNTYVKLERHLLSEGKLIISTYAFKQDNTGNQVGVYSNNELGVPVLLAEIPEWANITPIVTINDMDNMLFAYYKNPQANIVDMKSPLGISCFAKAIDLIQDADEQYANLMWEFDGSQLAIDVDRTALMPENSNGETKYILPKREKRLYRDNLDLGSDEAYHVFNPDIREQSITNGLNTILMQIEDKCSLSRGTLSQVQYTDARTATELKILKQRAYSDNQQIQTALQRTLEELFVIVDKYCDLYNIVPSGEYEIAYKWDDSIIVDKDTEKQADMLDVDKGLMSRVEYRMKWYGETEEQAKQTLKEIDEAQTEKMVQQQEVMMQAQQQKEDKTTEEDNKSDKQKDQDAKQKANESGKTTKKDDKKE